MVVLRRNYTVRPLDNYRLSGSCYLFCMYKLDTIKTWSTRLGPTAAFWLSRATRH